MKRYFTLLLVAIITLTSLTMFAGVRDLPVKKTGGKEYYYYKVGKGESVAGIANALGITSEEIIQHNRRAAGGVDKKMTLYFPVEAYATPVVEEVEVEEEIVADSPALRPAIVVALPFGLDNPTPTRTNRLALDFYRGFLLAADTLSQRGSAIEIVAVDTEGADFADRIADAAVATAQVTVAPAEADRMATLASLAADRGSWVLNVLNVPDTLYAVNAHVLQANVPQRNMYALAADAFIADYADYTPVVLRSTTGKNEKEAFVSYLTGRLESEGILPVEISYEDNLTSSHLDRLAPGGKYVFVPLSGSLTEFNKFAYVLKSWRDRLAAESDAAAAVNPDSYATTEVALFGYPDWTVFRGDALDMLHRLEAKVYSRFYDNFHSFDARTLESSFRRWYGEPILESVPSQAILGYDTGCYLIKNLRANNGEFSPTYPARYQGIQSTFDFDRDGDAGYYNSSLYIINYLPGDGISSRVL